MLVRQKDSFLPTAGPKAVDALIAGAGLFASISLLGLLEPLCGVPLFAPPMMASGIIFFGPTSPPSPTGFLMGTFCSATVSLAVLTAVSPVFRPAAAQGAAAGALLCFFKATSTIFPPTAVLAGSLVAAAAAAATDAPTTRGGRLARSLRWLCFPWLTGHAWLYGCAYALSHARSHARVAVTQRSLASLGEYTDESLAAIFERFDTDASGALDANELKVALRVALGLDLSLSDVTALLQVADKDGTESVDFDEFVAIVRRRL